MVKTIHLYPLVVRVKRTHSRGVYVQVTNTEIYRRFRSAWVYHAGATLESVERHILAFVPT